MDGNTEFRDWDFWDPGIPKISGFEFLGFRIPALQDFPGFPDFRDPEPHPTVQSCAYYFGQPLFQDSGETIYSAEKNDTSYEQAACFL